MSICQISSLFSLVYNQQWWPGMTEKIGLMCSTYNPSHYSTFLTFIVNYTSSVNCNKFSIVCCTSYKSFTGRLYWLKRLWHFKPKNDEILCAHKPCFLMLGHNVSLIYLCIYKYIHINQHFEFLLLYLQF